MGWPDAVPKVEAVAAPLQEQPTVPDRHSEDPTGDGLVWRKERGPSSARDRRVR